MVPSPHYQEAYNRQIKQINQHAADVLASLPTITKNHNHLKEIFSDKNTFENMVYKIRNDQLRKLEKNFKDRGML